MLALMLLFGIFVTPTSAAESSGVIETSESPIAVLDVLIGFITSAARAVVLFSILYVYHRAMRQVSGNTMYVFSLKGVKKFYFME